MILKDVKFGRTVVSTLLQFGDGRIAVMPALIKDNLGDSIPLIMFKQMDEHHPINEDIADFAAGKTSDEIKPDVVMSFSDIKSVETLMWALENIKNQFT